MSTMQISSITDAVRFVDNSGVVDWKWTGRASADGFAQWIRANRSEMDRDDYRAELREYLMSVGGNPADYSL